MVAPQKRSSKNRKQSENRKEIVMPESVQPIQRLAGFELNVLRASQVLGEEFEKAKVPRTGTPIYDINGTLLFYRLALRRGKASLGYADIAANEVLGEPLLAVSMGAAWNEKAILEEARAAARKGRRSLKFDSMRFVAYSFPKVAIQYLLDGQEVLMLEWKTWAEVPPQTTKGESRQEPNFERWSLIEEMPAKIRRSRVRKFKKRQAIWDTRNFRRIDPTTIRISLIDWTKVLAITDTREIHYAPRADDHHICYELRGQQTGVWCVAASVEMLLNFYRYRYDQPRLAQELDLGTCASPNGLPYGDEYKVVNTIESLSSNTLNATSIANPTFATFQTEIQNNRPLISFIPRHSRTVAGYTRSLLYLAGQTPFRGLLVYDPWPPTDCAHPEAGGVITTWENFDTQTYRNAFTAVLNHV
jgi:hypothetical protein